jgi:hypothetical protein
MNSYFNEKSIQVKHTGSMSSFGIELSSRYGKAWEIVEILNFTIEVAQKDLQTYVESIFYDSNANLCTFEFSKDLEQYSDEAVSIQDCAKKTIAQFEMFGHVGLGVTLENIAGRRVL